MPDLDLILKHPSSRPPSLSALIFGLDAPKMMEKTPLDSKINARRQHVCGLLPLARALGRPQAGLLPDLALLGLDFESLSRADELELHLAHLAPGGIFAPHLHFIGNEIYFGLQGQGRMRIGNALCNGHGVLKAQDAPANPASLSCRWSDARTGPLKAGSSFAVQAGEAHSLANPSESDLYFAFICGGWHLKEGGDRLFLPSVR